LHLKRLEIVGFKSFADAFELHFQKGISAIVGPNGCGKSNIADSIRWVLGSQSPRQLRADRMEDVIFSGSESRKPLGMAEVVLTFDNTERHLALDFDEVSVTRRIFRSGDTDYRINGNKCRLMDVTYLFADRGLGSSGYWILEAKMIETILSSRPEDRRFLFDEAAGIVKYKIQRHRAELKLDATSTDLERLYDIIAEVDRTVGALRKQVSTFRRFEKAETRIAELESLNVHRELKTASTRSDELASLEKEYSEFEEGLAAGVSASGARLAESRLELENAQVRLDEAHRRCSEQDARIAELDREHAVAMERSNGTLGMIEDTRRRSESQRKRAEELEELLVEKKYETSELEKELASIAKIRKKAGSDAAAARREYESSVDKLDEQRDKRGTLDKRLEERRNEHNRSLQKRERLGQELEHLLLSREQLETHRDSLEKELSRTSAENGRLTEEKEALTATLSSEESSLSSVSDALEQSREARHGLELDAEALRTRIEGLLSASAETRSSGNEASRKLRVRKGMEKAVGAYLDGFQDAVLVSDIGKVPGGAGERYMLTGRPRLKDRVPEGAIRLTDCLENDEPEIRDSLSAAILAPDRKTAIGWFLEQSPFDIVTYEGDLFRSDGLVRLGVPVSSSGSIDQRALASDASEQLAEREREIEQAGVRLSSLGEERDSVLKTLAGLRERERDLERDTATVSARLSITGEQLSRCIDEQDLLKEKIPSLEKAVSEVSCDSLERQIAKTIVELDGCAGLLAENEKVTASLAHAMNEVVQKESEIAYRVLNAEDRLEHARNEQERLRGEAGRALETVTELDERIAELQVLAVELEKRIKECAPLRTGLQEERKKAEEERTRASVRRASVLDGTGELDAALQKQREELSLLREKRAINSNELSSINGVIVRLEDREIQLPDDSSRFWDWDEEKIASELIRQRNFRENIGPVNMLAVNEHEEARGRLTYLSEQKNDLEEARESLRTAIDEINLTAARRFSETFVEVRRNFQDLFVSLFGGGEADLISLEGDDPLEGGVQILARPQGKKMENVSALSGGERALTAVALLFALYLVKPSPFCILDELDAPLDDSNIDRFIDLLRGFSDRTQFVIITHNKRTMEAADRLFGITMVEDGVSVLTTVSLEDAVTGLEE
jgi:chromosome segregation protein